MAGSLRRNHLKSKVLTCRLSTLLALFGGSIPPSHAQDAGSPHPDRSIAKSIERVVERIEEDRKAPCRRAMAQGIPCFPVSVEAIGPKYSVADSLRDFSSDTSPTPNRPPTVDEMRGVRSGALGAAGGASFDPVCAGKAFLKQIKGKNDTYFLYRVFDRSGPRVLLLDHALQPGTFPHEAEFQFELLGEYAGECHAVAAFRHAERTGAAGSETRAPSPSPPKQP